MVPPLSPAYGHSIGKTSPFQFHRVDLVLSMGDLNQDGHRDLVVPAINEMDELELRALSGSDGTLIWTRARNPDGLSQESLRNWTPPTVCDLNGDGNLEVACVEPTPMQVNGNANQPSIQISLLSGSDGNELWTHMTQSPFTPFRSFNDRQGQPRRPLVLQVGKDEYRIGVLLPGSNCKFASLDYHGHYQERDILSPEQLVEVQVMAELTPQVDGVVIVENSEIVVVSADHIDRAVWESKFGTLQQVQLLSTRKSEVDQCPELVVAKGATDNSVLGIDARSGKTLWICPGPIARDVDDGVYMAPQRIDWLGNRPNHAPLIVYSLQHSSECRQAVFANQEMDAMVSPEHAKRGTDRIPAVTKSSRIDSRWQRPLPWAIEWENSSQGFASFVLLGCFFALTMVLLPSSYIVYSVKRRQFGLRALLGLPLLASLFLFASLVPVPTDHDFRSIAGRLMIGLSFAVPLFAAYQWLKLVVTKRHWQAAIWLVVVIGCGFCLHRFKCFHRYHAVHFYHKKVSIGLLGMLSSSSAVT